MARAIISMSRARLKISRSVEDGQGVISFRNRSVSHPRWSNAFKTC